MVRRTLLLLVILVLARRLLIPAGGGDSIFAPNDPGPGVPGADVHESLTSAPYGGWPGQTGTYEHSGNSYYGWITGTGLVQAGVWDGSSVTTGTIRSGFQVDHHNAPALLRRASDGRIVTVYSGHSTSYMYRKISTNPDDISAWGTESNLDSSLGGQRYTYPNLFQLTGETDDPIYLFYREHPPVQNTSYLAMSKSTNGGSSFSAQQIIYRNPDRTTYWRVDSNGVDRFDFVVTTSTSSTASAYHFYYTGGSYYKTNGTLITATPPFVPADLTLVYSGASAGVRYPASLSAYDGTIAVGLVTQPGGPNQYTYARWNGSSWSSHHIVGAGAEAPFVEGGMAVDFADPNIVYLSRFIGGQWQMFRYVTADAGATWADEQLTNTESASFYPVAVRDAATGLRVVWLHGTFIGQSNFNLGTGGAD